MTWASDQVWLSDGKGTIQDFWNDETIMVIQIIRSWGIFRWLLLKRLPVHSFNALIIPILRDCLQSLFNIPVPWYLFDTVLKVISWPTFLSRCITDVYFSFCGLILDIDMNCGCWLYRSFYQRDFTYAIDFLLKSINGMNVAFLLTVSPPYTQLWLLQTDEE